MVWLGDCVFGIFDVFRMHSSVNRDVFFNRDIATEWDEPTYRDDERAQENLQCDDTILCPFSLFEADIDYLQVFDRHLCNAPCEGVRDIEEVSRLQNTVFTKFDIVSGVCDGACRS